MPKKQLGFQMPTVMKITGRSSSITNAFVNTIIPVIPPTDTEIEQALAILDMTPDDVRCAYCGDTSTEWDHLRPLVDNRKPTGYVSEIANLVPACGKCNQSKGKRHWREWIQSSARRSPATRNLSGIAERIAALERDERWREPLRTDFEAILDPDSWAEHWRNWAAIIELMKASQQHADRVRRGVADHMATSRSQRD